jgi:hypothetical protein
VSSRPSTNDARMGKTGVIDIARNVCELALLSALVVALDVSKWKRRLTADGLRIGLRGIFSVV